MEGYSRKDHGCHQFLDLVQKEKDFPVRRAEETSHGVSEEQKLELRLAPPGGDWSPTDNCRDHESLLSFGYYSNNPCPQNSILRPPWQHRTSYSLHLQSGHSGAQQGQLHTVTKEASRPCGSRVSRELQKPEKNVLSPTPANTAVPNTHKGTAPAPMVGWPPIRSFRKNLATGSSSKFATEPAKGCNPNNMENCPKNLFVKINMDGVPIGRKIDLKAYDSYEKLSNAVDALFKDLLAAQNKSSSGGIKGEEEGRKVIGGLLDRNREYNLVYEDNEGDRMLVGDVPWPMFASTVKRLRVLKNSELPKVSSGGKQGKLSLHK